MKSAEKEFNSINPDQMKIKIEDPLYREKTKVKQYPFKMNKMFIANPEMDSFVADEMKKLKIDSDKLNFRFKQINPSLSESQYDTKV